MPRHWPIQRRSCTSRRAGLGAAARSCLLASLAACALLGGWHCDSGSDTQGTGGFQPGMPGGAARQDVTPEPGAARPDPAVAPDSPVAAVRALVAGLAEDRPEALWKFLPASYRADLNELAHFLAQRVDADLWKAALRVAGKFGGLWKTRSAELAGAAAGAGHDRWRDAQWLAALLAFLARSELADLERLKQIDLGAWIEQAGPELMAELSAAPRAAPGAPWAAALRPLRNLDVSVVKAENDFALLRFAATGEPPVDLPYRRVEGQWIPQGLADGWVEALGQIKARLAVVLDAENMARARPRWLVALDRVERRLDLLAQTESSAAFQEAVAQGAADFAALAELVRGASSPGAAKSAAPAPLPVVKLVLPSAVALDVQHELLQKLRKLLDPGDDPLLEFSASDTETVLTVGPVEDPRALLRKLDFLRDAQLDLESRTIRGELAR